MVAQGFYGAGLRILDVRDAREITQHGYVTSGATQVWDAYWVPERNAAGKAIPGKKTNLVYTADAVRGVEVYEVDLGTGSGTLDVVATTTTGGPSGSTVTPALLLDAAPHDTGTGGPGGDARGTAAAAGAGLAGLAVALLAAAATRRRRAA